MVQCYEVLERCFIVELHQYVYLLSMMYKISHHDLADVIDSDAIDGGMAGSCVYM